MSYSELSQQIESMTNILLDYSDETILTSSPTNREQINLLIRDPKVKSRITQIIKSKQYPHPYLTIELCSDDNCEIELDADDIKQVCSNFGEVKNVYTKPSNGSIVIKFGSLFDAYVVFKLLNRHPIKELDAIIKIEFTSMQDLMELSDMGNNEMSQQKFTCRYDVQIDNDRDFQVARKIIGAKGCNMKRIIDMCLAEALDCKEPDLIKLRLRGKGSGYKEGPEKRESNEPLHLCVSSKHNYLFQKACQQVEQLLGKIYDEYIIYTQTKGFKTNNMQIRKLTQANKCVNMFPQFNKHSFMHDLPNFNFQNFPELNSENVMNYANMANQLM